MTASESAEVPLTVSFVGDSAAATDTATRIPGPLADGTPPDPVEVVSWYQPDDDGATDYEDPAVLRGGDSGQTFGVGGCPPADLSGLVDGGSGGDGGE